MGRLFILAIAAVLFFAVRAEAQQVINNNYYYNNSPYYQPVYPPYPQALPYNNSYHGYWRDQGFGFSGIRSSYYYGGYDPYYQPGYNYRGVRPAGTRYRW